MDFVEVGLQELLSDLTATQRERICGLGIAAPFELWNWEEAVGAAHEVLEAWRTSCPRLTIWEDAVDRGYVTREAIAGAGVTVAVTEDGEKFLRTHGRVS